MRKNKIKPGNIAKVRDCFVEELTGKIISVKGDIVLLEVAKKQWADISLGDIYSKSPRRWLSIGFEFRNKKPDKGNLFVAFHRSELA